MVSRWNDCSYWAIKESSEMSHKKLLKLMKKYTVKSLRLVNVTLCIVVTFSIARLLSSNLSSRFYKYLFLEALL